MTIKVLVVDRTRDAEHLAKECLTPLGCQVITASSTALGVFLARKNFPSLVIAGLSETDDHTDLPAELKADPELAHIPVVFVYAPGRTQEPGADKHLRMPISSAEFIAEVAPYLQETVDERQEETSE